MEYKRSETKGMYAMLPRWFLLRVAHRAGILVMGLVGLFMLMFSFNSVSVHSRLYVLKTQYMSTQEKPVQIEQIKPQESIAKHASSSTPAMKLEIKDESDRLFNAQGLKPINRKFMKFQYPVTKNRPYLIENPTLCSSVPNLTVLVIVHTSPNHFDRRQNARRTWTNETYFQDLGRLKILFLLGRVKEANIQKQIDQEFKDHNDLLQGDFIDAYHNLTHKGVMAYKWITQRCRNAKLIVKVDDDVMVDTYKLFTAPEYLPFFRNKTKQIVCNHIHPDTMPILRDKGNKWYVNKAEFRDENLYPRYCSGFLVMISNDVIPAIYRAATVTPFFWVDDVYLYGLVPTRVHGIRYKGLKHGTHMLSASEGMQCYRSHSKECNYIVVEAANAKQMDEVWGTMTYIYRHAGQQPTTPSPPTTPTPAKKTTTTTTTSPVNQLQ